MKRFLAQHSHFWPLVLLLLLAIVAVSIIPLFYLEEDWRGAHEWAATKAEWEAKGESFDLKKFIPPTVPNDQNIAALPLFALGNIGTDDHPYRGLLNLKKALHIDDPRIEIPLVGKWVRGEMSDLPTMRKVLTKDYEHLFPSSRPPEDSLELFNAVYPFYADFITAASTRPYFRLDADYDMVPAWNRPLGPITDGIRVSQLLTVHAAFALEHHQPEQALTDIQTNFKLCSGLKKDPTLVGGLVGIGMLAINNAALYDGLTHHVWNDQQLKELDQMYATCDFLSDFRFAMRSEVIFAISNLDYIRKVSDQKERKVLSEFLTDSGGSISTYVPWPDGWWDDNNRQYVSLIFRDLAVVDPQRQLVFPELHRQLQQELDNRQNRVDAKAPWNILFVVGTSGVIKSARQYAKAQVLLDEARIACALERYRLAHGTYPASLAALTPACIDDLPHDIMNGQQYTYQVRPDGTYTLYSVGWNQTDEGGQFAYDKKSPKIIDYDNGDWPWPSPKSVSP